MNTRKFSATAAVLAVTVFTSAALTGCASGQSPRADEERPVTATEPGGVCLNISQARDFRHLAPNHVIVYAPTGRPYHLELSNCRELTGQHQIALRGRTNQLCGVAGDEVIVRGAFTERCPVIRVTRVDTREIDALIDRFSTGPRSEGDFEVVIPQRED